MRLVQNLARVTPPQNRFDVTARSSMSGWLEKKGTQQTPSRGGANFLGAGVPCPAGFNAEPSGAELCRITGYVMHSNLHLEAPRWTTCRKNVRVSCMYMLHLSCSLLQTRVELCLRLDAAWLRCRRRAGQPLRCIRAMRSSASHDQRL